MSPPAADPRRPTDLDRIMSSSEGSGQTAALDVASSEEHVKRAIALSRDGRLEEVEAELTAALELDPVDADALHLRALARAALGRHSEAVADYDRVLELDSEDATAYCQRGDARAALGDVEGAAADYGRAIERRPSWVEPRLSRARSIASSGDLERAIAEVDAVLELDPKNVEAHRLRGIQEEALGRYDKARDDYSRVLELGGDSSDAYRNRGDATAALGDLDGAIADLTHAIELDPAAVDALVSRASVFESRGESEQAIADYTTVLKLDAANLEACLGRARAYAAMNSAELALQDYDTVVAFDPDRAEGYIGRADALAALGEDERAVVDYDRALDLDASDPSLHRTRILAQFRVGDEYFVRGLHGQVRETFSQALAATNRALDLHPDDPTLCGYRAISLRLLGAFDWAVEAATTALEKADKESPQTRAWLHRERGDSFRQWGDILQLPERLEDALLDFSQATEIAGDDAEALAFELWGYTLSVLGRDEAAVQKYEAAASREPTAGWTHLGHGKASYLLERLDDAEHAFQQALETGSDHARWAQVGLGLILEKRGTHDEAARAFEEALDRVTETRDADDDAAQGLDEASGRTSDADAHLQRAHRFAYFRALDRAETDYRRAVELEPSSADALNALAWFYVFEGLTDRLPAALELAKRAVVQAGSGPWRASYLDTAGWIAYRMGRTHEANALLREAVRLETHPVALRGHLEEVERALSPLGRSVDVAQELIASLGRRATSWLKT